MNTTRILRGFPPNIAAIRERFTLSGREFFSWGDKIYNPSGADLSDALLAHEAVHQKQQGADIEGWWDRYLADNVFRFAQELEAHREEYRVYCETARNRLARRSYLVAIARRLASPMYGKMCTVQEARLKIQEAPR